MELSIGIVGLPNVGKSTLFNALTKQRVAAENFPFCTIDPSVGVVEVPDKRLYELSVLSSSEETIPAAVAFVDIAGLVKGAADGEGLGNKFLSNIREVDAILHVVRIFDDTGVTHVHGRVDPLEDIGVINLELMMADLETVSKRLLTLEKELKKGEKKVTEEFEFVSKISEVLEGGKLARTVPVTSRDEEVLKSLHLLTMKPMLYALNKKTNGFNLDEEKGERWKRLMEFFSNTETPYVLVDAGVESEIATVSSEDETMFRQEFGVHESGVRALIREGYDLLGLISFFTTGKKETRAWTVKAGSTIKEAGAAIHSDFRDKFIRAEVVRYRELLAAGSYTAAREKGFVRTEGKEYIVQDGDVITFKI